MQRFMKFQKKLIIILLRFNDKNFLKVSAKDGKNINEAFELMIDLYELTVNNNQNIIENENEIKETKNKGNKKLKEIKNKKDESRRCC